ncbi:Entericidin, EcnA/B family [Alteromonas sp. 38]|uniref:entericidin A/B family lipoprotein n=1 Tax=Alteromonas TaxID=226 RepID=UPI0012F462E5|nr:MULTISPECIES: entericidin A/B family lipoprotein [Alteromonas]CAD5272280.1 Entericidin, EcnA/B family [Alteromonas sp. 154]VXB51523.1 Entericidin, EcnA/B family [Alteromonas sp. 38]
MKRSVLSSFLKSKLLRGSFTALLFSSAVVGVNGCATVEGAGEDIQSAGEAIEEGAEDASN